MDFKIYDGTSWVNPCKRPFAVLDENKVFQDVNPKLKEIYYYNNGWKLMDCSPDPSGICLGYGYLYNADVFSTDGLSLTNGSWRVPTKSDWDSLISFDNDALKTKGLIANSNGVWSGVYAGATNNLRFSSLPAGLRDGYGNFNSATSKAYYWSSTNYTGDTSRFVVKYQDNTNSTFNEIPAAQRGLGLSIRLVRAATTAELSIPDGKTSEDSALPNYTGNDGKTYSTVKIGTLVWTRENLRETKFSNLTPITLSQTKEDWLKNFSDEVPSYCEYVSDTTPVYIDPKDSETAICEIPQPITPLNQNRGLCSCSYGYNYNSFAAADSRFGNGSGVGYNFVVASSFNWTILFSHIGGTLSNGNEWNVGTKLKCDMRSGQWDGTNDYGLNIYATIVRLAYDGSISSNGYFGSFDEDLAYFWTSNSHIIDFGYISNVVRDQGSPSALGHGYPVRLVRLATPFELTLADGYTSDGINLPFYFGNDTKMYYCVKIGPYVWVAENSRETKWNDGTDIPYVNSANKIDFWYARLSSSPAYGFPETLADFDYDQNGLNQQYLDGIEPCDTIY